jgi:hypothetical protein
MVQPKQQELDFEKPVPVVDIPENTPLSAEPATEEQWCIQWCWPRTIWFHELSWWKALPSYTRAQYLSWYREMRDSVDAGRSGYSFAYRQALAEDSYQHSKAIAESWAEHIREAAKRGQPVPIRPVPRDEWLLDWACEIAGVLVVAAAPAS